MGTNLSQKQIKANESMTASSVDLSVAIFETIQGEGCFAGQAAFFIRLQGCNVRCHFCDEKSTWLRKESLNSLEAVQEQSSLSDKLDKSMQKKQAAASLLLKPNIEASEEEILDLLKKTNPKLKKVVITGGEPTEQNLEALIRLLTLNDYQVSIETAATGKYLNTLWQEYSKATYITFSPKEIYSKSGVLADPKIWQRCDEIKMVISNEKALDYVKEQILPQLEAAENHCSVFLVPDWFDFEANKERILGFIRNYPQLKIAIQMHKYLGVN